jgi:large subunit ribosomal protein L34e
MPNPNNKFKKHRTIRKPSGKITRVISKKKKGIHKCAICRSKLHGVPHGLRDYEVKKLSKTQRRPENLLASQLCAKCRDFVYQNAVMLKYNLKNKEDIDYRYKKYVDQIINKIE